MPDSHLHWKGDFLMNKRIDLTQFEGMEEWEVEKQPDGGYAIKTGRDNFSLEEAETIAKLPTLIDELKKMYAREDELLGALRIIRDDLDDQPTGPNADLFEHIQKIRNFANDASLGMSVDKPKCRNCGATTNLHQNRFDKKHDCGACLQELRDMNDFDSQHSF